MTSFRFLFLLCVFCNVSFAAEKSNYLPGTEDIPLMSELAVIPETYMNFDHPEGRVVTVSATGKITTEQLTQFYDMVLNQLGWQKENTLTYTREGDVLQIECERSKGEEIDTLQVTFQLKPQNK